MPNSNLQAFEGVIRAQLKSLGYHNIEILKEKERSFNVIADGTLRQIFLRVLIKLVSEHFQGFSPDEISTIKKEAHSVEKEPWAAILSVNEEGKLVDKIRWTNLAKHSA